MQMTDIEAEIMELLREQKTFEEIALELDLTPQQVNAIATDFFNRAFELRRKMKN